MIIIKKASNPTLLLIILVSFLTFSCSGDKPKEESTETNTKETETKQLENISPDYQTLIQGHWQTEDGEGKIQFDAKNVYNPEQELDRTFEIQDQSITYKSAEGSYTNKIVELTKDRFVEENEDGYKTTWIRPESKKEVVSLEGEWKAKEGEMGYMKFEGSQVDMAVMGLYSYTIEGDKIMFKNIKNGVDFSKKFIKMTDTELVLENEGVTETYVRK